MAECPYFPSTLETANMIPSIRTQEEEEEERFGGSLV